MNKLLMGTLIVAATVTGCDMKGCNKTSETGGRAGNDTFRLSVPALATNVKQGEVQTVRVSLDRGAGFKQRVKLEVQAPAGIKVEPNSTTVEPGDKGDVQFTITAAKDAPIGECKILVKGTPDKGESTETEFKVTVSAK